MSALCRLSRRAYNTEFMTTQPRLDRADAVVSQLQVQLSHQVSHPENTRLNCQLSVESKWTMVTSEGKCSN